MPRLVDAEKLAEYKASDISNLTEWQKGWNDAIDTIMNETPTVEALPIDWIIDWLTKQTVPALHTCDDYDAVNMMLDDWEKENEQNKENTSQTD